METKTDRILVIDDEKVIRDGCRLVLSGIGYMVMVCATGQEGIDMALEDEYDVILLDMKLPDMNGMDILRTVHMKKPDSYIIVMTGYSTVQNAVEAMKAGAFDYLTKPFTDDELVLITEKAIEKKRLTEENIFLRKELLNHFSYDNIVGDDPSILHIFEQLEKVAPTDTTVLLCGESGTGKELFAGTIHSHSKRQTRQLVAVDCSTLSPSLLESELFGHVKGAFTGAVQDKQGIFELACGGTLFMDDITNLTLEIQGKLLRVLEEGEYKPVGANNFKKTDIRIIAATNKDLKGMVQEEKFREDLFYRLNVFPIYIPPLRERKSDIPKLAYHFLRRFCRKTGKRIEGFSDDALEALVNFEWPGNVRQLKNVIERLVIMSDNRTLDLIYLLSQLQLKRSWREDPVPETYNALKDVKQRLLQETFGQIEKAFLIKALKACSGNISHAAERVGMQRANFSTLLKKHNLSVNSNKEQK